MPEDYKCSDTLKLPSSLTPRMPTWVNKAFPLGD
jgi:hypothetical protein